jgi:MraZ protein
MLRGSHTAKIDERGRLKVPAGFRRFVEERYGRGMFVTSLDGRSVRMYPQVVWQEIEEKLSALPTTNPARQKFLNVVNYWGQMTTMDGQGRVLVPPELREAAEITDEVRVIGQQTYLDVWNQDRFAKKIAEEPLTNDDFEVLSDLGV